MIFFLYEPAHQILVPIVYAQKPLLNADIQRGLNPNVWLEHSFSSVLCEKMALARLCVCTGMSEPSLSTKTLCAA